MELNWDNFFLIEYRKKRPDGTHEEIYWRGTISNKGMLSYIYVRITGTGEPPLGNGTAPKESTQIVKIDKEEYIKREGPGVVGIGYVRPVERISPFRYALRKCFRWWAGDGIGQEDQ